MLESVSMDALGIAVTILAAICSPLVGHVLSNPRWRLQAVLKHHQQSNAVTVVLRNVSSRTVFVDRVMLYHPSFLPRPFRQFASGMGVQPGRSESFDIDGDYLRMCIDMAGSAVGRKPSRSGADAFDTSFKLVLKTSEGMVWTNWFEVRDTDVLTTVSFHTSRGRAYYPLKRFFNQSVLCLGFAAVPAIALVPFAVREIGTLQESLMAALIAYSVLLVYLTVYSSGGFTRRLALIALSFCAGLPLLSAAYIWGLTPLLCVMFYLGITFYHHALLSWISGWD